MIDLACAHCDYTAKLNDCDRDMATRLLASHVCAPKRLSWVENGKVKSAMGAGLINMGSVVDADTAMTFHELITVAMRIPASNTPPPTMAVYLVSEDN